ncbi:MAG: dTDP-4-dehydrorhamnose reductase [Lentisphaerae bacterium]|nr:dTDP-4-dehydrorhamnose reductase [Lentisphaerota bacterium]MBT4820802.1 dTDP-4-dehydrorhamnose reductase [Lentisphaerota bacterium]MBT5606253.1 dTDP-4-dehydrorhamnose reductase [Lentisphaerota bacterium]MBT7054080.1 dTDP-4-dehydrorhamnose reductase [Lentisphaerota bacterium]MBT7845119.1 dTDP-4-dehydrorhamnose reductase [Lentisphaerota bacterium]
MLPFSKIAVLGGRGMLGTELCCQLAARGVTVTAYDLPEFDICNESQLADAVGDADAVVNCAAYTNVDGAEAQPNVAEAVNAGAMTALGELAARAHTHVIHVSTDFVFNGASDRPYNEDDDPSPLSVYGKTKLRGERAVLGADCPAAVVRVQWTFGQAGNNFITKFLERVAGGGDLLMVDDQHGAPTWTHDVSHALIELLEQQTTGLYHFAASGYTTRYSVAEHILDVLGLKRNLAPCRTADFPAAAERPLNSRFDCTKIDSILTRPRPAWKDSLTTFLEELKDNGRIPAPT